MDYLKSILHYDPRTGIFIWKVKRKTVNVGDRAGTYRTRGYRAITINRIAYFEHKLAWYIYYGYWPEFLIDHKDRDTGNNKIKNLRKANLSKNNANSNLNIRNTSGYRGVYFRRNRNKWVARIMINHKKIELGMYKTAEEAAQAVNIKGAEHFGKFWNSS